MQPLPDALALAAVAAWRGVSNAVDHAGKVRRQRHLADAGRSHEQIGVRKTAFLQTAREGAYRPRVSDSLYQCPSFPLLDEP